MLPLKVPFYRPSIGEDEINEVVDTLRSGWLTTGPKTKQFESEFATLLGVKHAVAVNSCTAALHLGLEALGVKEGDGVIVPTMTFAATAEVVRYLHAHPILVDCRAEDFTMDIADADRKIQAALTRGERVTAIMPVHYAGQIGDIYGVKRLADKYQLKIVEDAAHCCPAFCRVDEHSPWDKLGALAHVSCYSFYANKTITTGEGGMACTNHSEIADRMRIMCLHGISRDAWKRFSADGSWYYEIVAPGFKYNLTDIASAIGLHQLRKAELLMRKRSHWANRYTNLLRDVEELILPCELPNRIHSWHLYVIRLQLDRLTINRNEFINALKQAGIGISVHWTPLHMHPYYREQYGYQPENLPQAASLYQEIITLPLFPNLTEADVDYVCAQIKSIVARHRRVA